MKLTLLSLGVAAVLFLAQVESFGFGTSGIVGLLSLFLVPGAGLGCAVWGMARHRSTVVARGVSLVFAAVLAFVGAAVTTNAQEEASRRRGDELCRTLETFHRTTGAYPETLEVLVPRFLPRLPQTCMSLFRSFPFHYSRREDGLDYCIAFDSPCFIVCQRGSNGSWRRDD